MKGKGIESIFDATHQWFPLSYWVTYERLCFLFFGALFPPNCYKCLYFFLVALYVIPELYKFSFPVIFTWPECAPGTLSSSQGPNSFLPLVTLTLAVLCLLLLHHQDRSCYLVSSHTLSANATCTFEHLARLFPDLPFLTDASPGFLSLAGPAAQPSTVKLEKSCSSWSRSSHLWAIKFFHSLKVRIAKLQKHLSYLSIHRFLFFSLPMQNSNHCQRDLKQ